MKMRKDSGTHFRSAFEQGADTKAVPRLKSGLGPQLVFDDWFFAFRDARQSPMSRGAYARFLQLAVERGPYQVPFLGSRIDPT